MLVALPNALGQPFRALGSASTTHRGPLAALGSLQVGFGAKIDIQPYGLGGVLFTSGGYPYVLT